MVVGILCLIALEKQSRVEDEVDILLNEPADVAVDKLCRVTCRLGRNGFDAEFVDLVRACRREDDAVAELFEESRPERVVLVYTEDTRNADGPAGSLVSVQRFIVEDSLQLIFIEVRNAVCILLEAEAALAAVAGDELTAAGKAVDR